MLRLRMFVTATCRIGQEVRTAVPASSVLHCMIATGFTRPWKPDNSGVEVTGGNMLPGKMQEIVSGLEPGQRVVADALVLQNTVEQ